MRDEFLEPLQYHQMNATLLFGKKPVSCNIVAITDDGYCVAVPGIDQYEGDPRLTLATEDEVIPVKLVLQESHLDGYYFWLVRRDLLDQTKDDQSGKVRWRKKAAQYGIPMAVAALLAIFLSFPGSSEVIAFSSITSLGLNLVGAGSQASETKNVDGNPSGQVQVAAKKSSGNVAHPNTNAERARSSNSLISPASMSSSSPAATREDVFDVSAVGRLTSESVAYSNVSPETDANQLVSLKSLLQAGQVGRVQTITRCLIPWLFDRRSDEVSLSIRMSDAACQDLLQFEVALRNLPRKASADAISTLRRSLDSMATDTWKAKPISDLPNVFVFASRDANIYFQIVRGRVELVRVLPIDYSSES
jgi:hypothetical protein